MTPAGAFRLLRLCMEGIGWFSLACSTALMAWALWYAALDFARDVRLALADRPRKLDGDQA